MQYLLKLPLYFFLIASLLGLLLRWYHYQPINGWVYPFWLHAHSHVMFLGWVFNALTVGFIISFLDAKRLAGYNRLLLLANLMVAGMLVSFPLQGYGTFSILISTLHTVLIAIFAYRFFRDTNTRKDHHAVWLARASLWFFMIAAIGPFVLGALVANGLGQSQWYRLAVYYYLHFQYNGTFVFGVLALLFHWLERVHVPINDRAAKQLRLLLFVACFPAYALSTLWTEPGTVTQVIGLLAALTQLAAVALFMGSMRRSLGLFLSRVSVHARFLLVISALSFGAKLVLQLLSSHQAVARLAYQVPIYVIAYLHLVLLGMVSFFLLAWYADKGVRIGSSYLALMIAGFVFSEVLMIGIGGALSHSVRSFWLVVASLLMVIGISGVAWNAPAVLNWKANNK
jgi:hypothetical protein